MFQYFSKYFRLLINDFLNTLILIINSILQIRMIYHVRWELKCADPAKICLLEEIILMVSWKKWIKSHIINWASAVLCSLSENAGDGGGLVVMQFVFFLFIVRCFTRSSSPGQGARRRRVYCSALWNHFFRNAECHSIWFEKRRVWISRANCSPIDQAVVEFLGPCEFDCKSEVVWGVPRLLNSSIIWMLS